MDLGEAGVGEISPFAIGPPEGADIALHRIGGEKVDVGIATTRQHHGIRCVRLQLAADEVPAHHPPRHAIDQHQLHQIAAGQQVNPARLHLPQQGLHGAVQQLLARLPPGIKGATHQCAAKTAVGQGAAVLAGEGHPLGHALVDDRRAQLGQTKTSGLPGPEITSLDGVAKQAGDAVAVVGVILGGVDAPLGRHRVGPPGAVVICDQAHHVALFCQRSGRRSPRQATAHDQHPQLAFLGCTDQGQILAVALPSARQRSGRHPGVMAPAPPCTHGCVRSCVHGCAPQARTRLTRQKPPPSSTAARRPSQRSRPALAPASSPRLRWALSTP